MNNKLYCKVGLRSIHSIHSIPSKCYFQISIYFDHVFYNFCLIGIPSFCSDPCVLQPFLLPLESLHLCTAAFVLRSLIQRERNTGNQWWKYIVFHRFSVFSHQVQGVFMGFHGVSCFQISFSLKMGFCNFSTRNFGDRTNVESSARVIGLSSRKMAEIEFQGCAVGVLFSQDISLIIWPAN